MRPDIRWNAGDGETRRLALVALLAARFGRDQIEQVDLFLVIGHTYSSRHASRVRRRFQPRPHGAIARRYVAVSPPRRLSMRSPVTRISLPYTPICYWTPQ